MNKPREVLDLPLSLSQRPASFRDEMIGKFQNLRGKLAAETAIRVKESMIRQ
jgi:hypothetical protein